MWSLTFCIVCAVPVLFDGVVKDIPSVPFDAWDTHGVTLVRGSPLDPLLPLVEATLGGFAYCYDEVFRRVAPLRGYGIGTVSAEVLEHTHDEGWFRVRIWSPQESPLVQPLAIKTECCGWHIATGAIVFRGSLPHRAVPVVGEEALSTVFEPLFQKRCDIPVPDPLTDVEVLRKQAVYRQPSVESWVLYDVFPSCRLIVHGRENVWARVEVTKECLDARKAKPFMVPSLDKPTGVKMMRLGYIRWLDYNDAQRFKHIGSIRIARRRVFDARGSLHAAKATNTARGAH